MSRTQILDRLRRVEGWEPPTLAPLPGFPTFSDPAGQIASAFEAAGGIFLDARGGQIEACLKEVLSQTQATEIFWEREDIFQRHGISNRLRDPKAFQNGRLVYSQHPRQTLRLPLLLHSKPWNRRNLDAVPLSVSSASFGIAETGTLLHEVGPGQGRLLSILPAAQLFLLSEKQLVHNAAELFSLWKPVRGSLATLVTGPSRTADIEKTLVIGVHGPCQCLLILSE